MRRHNIEMAGTSTAFDERQRLVREIEALEREGDAAHEAARARRRAAGFEHLDSPSAGRKRVLSIESAVADPMLSTAQRALAKEEAAVKVFMRHERDRKRLAELIAVTEDRSMWAAELLFRTEQEERSTLALLFASKVAETRQRERARRAKERLEAQVDEYVQRRQLIDDLQRLNVEDRWLTRELVLREAEENREAGRQVEQHYRQVREHVFLDEADVFASMSG